MRDNQPERSVNERPPATELIDFSRGTQTAQPPVSEQKTLEIKPLTGGGTFGAGRWCGMYFAKFLGWRPVKLLSGQSIKGIVMKLETLRELFVHELKDLYSAEKQMTRILPKMAEAAGDEGLKAAFKGHLKETKQQIQRLDHLFSKLEDDPKGFRCKAMAGLIREVKSLLRMKPDQDVLDAGLISAAQRIEHYEIAAYGTARAYAEKLGEQAAVELLQESLNEEGAADKKLTDLAESGINADALNEEEVESPSYSR